MIKTQKRISAGLAVVALATTALLGTGCAPQLDRIETAVQENQDEMNRMEVQNQRISQEIEALAALIRLDRDAGDETGAMRLARLTQVATRLEQVLQQLEDNNAYMRDLSARVDLLATRSGMPTLGEYKPPTSSAASSALPEEGRSILAAAELDRSRGNVDLARAGYTEFLEKFGNSEAADDALFGLADVAYGEGDHTQALVHFQDLLVRFPNSEKLPAALYKSRACYLALGQKEDAWTMGGELTTRFPESEEAVLLQAEVEETRQ